MKSFYKAVDKDLQKKPPLNDELLLGLSCLGPKMQKTPKSLQYYKVLAHEMPSVAPEDEVKAGDEWVKYMDIDISQIDQKGRVDHFWKSIFEKAEVVDNPFVVLPKMVKCALTLCHSNADVERSLSVNKRMITKQNVVMKTQTVVGLRAVKAAVQENGSVKNTEFTKKW